MNILKSYHLILGSNSPRRKQILQESGLSFTQKVIPIPETYPAILKPEQVPSFLARKKATAFADVLTDKDIVLTADSVVILGEDVLEKPADAEEAYSMLSALSGQWHKVTTGVCLKTRGIEKIFSCTSEVNFASLSRAEINYYIEHYHPFDKAGAYGIQEWIGHCKIREIRGSYLNIVGLPMHLVYENLNTLVNELENVT